MSTLVAYIDPITDRAIKFAQINSELFETIHFSNGIQFLNWYKHNPESCKVIVTVSGINSPDGLQLLEKFKQQVSSLIKPAFVIADSQFTFADKKLAVKTGVSEIILEADILEEPTGLRLLNLAKQEPKKRVEQQVKSDFKKYKTPTGKRLFDVLVSFTALLFLSPFLLIIAIIIKLESKGPVYYKSKRVGAGFQIFDFYKFRSMDANADKKLQSLSHLNQYAETANTTIEVIDQCEICLAGGNCGSKLYFDTGSICEKIYLLNKEKYKDSTFIKIKEDPRITRFGHFIRKTSLDELPQLVNVLKGDMSLVGNRPLPLYEAEKLTTDALSQRFMAPAGITGLWQVTKRGQATMSTEERMYLDNSYARNQSLLGDIAILLKTVPALFQKENV